MLDLKDYGILPREVLVAGATLRMNVHVLLPQNETLIHYRKTGDVLNEKDVLFFSKIVASHLYFPISEIKPLFEMRAQVTSLEIKKGNLNSEVVKQSAVDILKSVSSESDITQNLEAVGAYVRELIRNFVTSTSVLAYDDALKRAAENSTDPLTAHHQQVSSIGVLMAMGTGDFSMDDLSDIAAAGLTHDLGMKDITQTLSDDHLHGIKDFSNSEKIIYMRHIDLTLERMKKEKLALTPGMQRIIEHHHENWNGTGFRSLEGNRIFRPARVLRLADDVVSFIHTPNRMIGFAEALEEAEKLGPVHDPVVLSRMRAATA